MLSWPPHTASACLEVLLGRKERSPLTETTESKWYSECLHSPTLQAPITHPRPLPSVAATLLLANAPKCRESWHKPVMNQALGGWRRSYAQESTTQTKETRQTFKMPRWNLSSNWFPPTDLGRSDASRSWGGKGLGQFSTLTNNSGYKVCPSGLRNIISHERKGLAFT